MNQCLPQPHRHPEHGSDPQARDSGGKHHHLYVDLTAVSLLFPTSSPAPPPCRALRASPTVLPNVGPPAQRRHRPNLVKRGSTARAVTPDRYYQTISYEPFQLIEATPFNQFRHKK